MDNWTVITIMVAFVVNVVLTIRRARDIKKTLRVQAKYHEVVQTKLGPAEAKKLERIDSRVVLWGMSKSEVWMMGGYTVAVLITLFNAFRALGVIPL